MRWIALTCLAASLGCGTHYPEGVYPCQPPTVATDCPAMRFCHSAHTCWSSAETFDGGATDAGVANDAASDAFTIDAASLDAGTDAAATDAGCMPATETCNGADDDCDGMIDEDL